MAKNNSIQTPCPQNDPAGLGQATIGRMYSCQLPAGVRMCVEGETEEEARELIRDVLQHGRWISAVADLAGLGPIKFCLKVE